jgi:uncharacterized membrane protein YeaQ/YmgE (transglycosylase-associated protein family)
MQIEIHMLLGCIAGLLAGRTIAGSNLGIVINGLIGLIGGCVGDIILRLSDIGSDNDLIYLITAFLVSAILISGLKNQ